MKKKIDSDTQLLEDAGVFKPDLSDPKIGPAITRATRQIIDFVKKNKIDKQIIKLNKTSDSLKKEIYKKNIEINERGYIPKPSNNDYKH